MNVYTMEVWLHYFPDHTFEHITELTVKQEELVAMLDAGAGGKRDFMIEGVGLREVRNGVVKYYLHWGK